MILGRKNWLFDAVKELWLWVTTWPSYADAYELRVSLEGADLRVVQFDEAEDAQRFAARLAQQAGFACVPCPAPSLR